MGLFSKRITDAILPSGVTLEVQVWDEKAFAALAPGRQKFNLQREPANRADKNAVRVNAAGKWIGYLNAVDAKRYAKLFDQIPVPIWVDAKVNGHQAVVGVPRTSDLEKWISKQRFG